MEVDSSKTFGRAPALYSSHLSHFPIYDPHVSLCILFHPLPSVNTCTAERRSPSWGQALPSTLRPSFARGGGPTRAGLGQSAIVRRFLPHEHARSLRRRPRVAERCSRGLGRGCGRPGTVRRGAAGGEGSAAASLGGATAGLGGRPASRALRDETKNRMNRSISTYQWQWWVIPSNSIKFGFRGAPPKVLHGAGVDLPFLWSRSAVELLELRPFG